MANRFTTVKEGIRTFNARRADGTKVLISTRRPTQVEINKARWELSAIFNQALIAGLPTRNRMIHELELNGQWTQEHKEKLTAAMARANELELKQTEGMGQQIIDDIMAEKENAQKEVSFLRSEIEAMLEHTADAKAEEGYRQFLIACVTEYADGENKGQRVWDTVEDYLNEPDQFLAQRAAYEFMFAQAGLESKWEQDVDAKLDRNALNEPKAEETAPAESQK